MIWYKELGYAYNPFTIKPGFFDDEVVGYDKEIETLIDWLKEDSMCFLEAEYGLGKSTILKFLINEFRGDYRIAHISRNRSDRSFNYEKLLVEANKGLGKFFGKKAKEVILIIDETERLNEKDCKAIEQLYQKGFIKSVLFMDSSFKKTKFSQEIKEAIGKNILKLNPLTGEQAVELARSRLEENQEWISDDVIKKVFEKSNKNTRFFLLNLEDLFKRALDAGEEKITKELVETI
jgi:chromosomal replication initiation ATPase DnaA